MTSQADDEDPNNLNINPIDIPTKHVTNSIRSLASKRRGDDNEALKFNENVGYINLDPPDDAVFDYFLNYDWYRKLRSLFLVSTYSRIHGPVFRSHYVVYQERVRQLASYPWMIHPYSTFRWCWDIMVSLFLVATLIGQPILITFYVGQLREKSHVVISCVQGFVFGVDIILNFKTGYTNARCDTISLDSSDVFWHYMRTWFAIDLLSTIPYDAIFVTIDDNTDMNLSLTHYHMVKYIRLLELLKVFRLVRVIRYFTRFQEAYMIDALYIRVINLHIVIFFTLHWIGCLHYLVADMCRPDDGLPPRPLSWVSRLDLWDEPVVVKYVNCVLRAISNMACLGYGAEVPRETEDILCTIFSVMCGATFFALFIGNLSSILINVDVAQKKYAEVLNQVAEYLRFKQIPKELQNRVMLYYEHRYRRNFFNEVNILQSVSDVLRQELQMFNCRRLVEEVPLFHGLPTAIVQNIVGRLQFEVYLPQDVVIGAHTVGDSMYFIEHGAVSVLAPNGKAVAHLRDGDFFGELALITNERRNATVVATSYCDMYRLEREDFEEAIMGYPEVYNQLVTLAERRAARTTKVADKVLHVDEGHLVKQDEDESKAATVKLNDETPSDTVNPVTAEKLATKPIIQLMKKDKIDRKKSKRIAGSGSVSDIN